MKKKLVLMTFALMAISLLAGCGNAHSHEYKFVDEEYSQYATCIGAYEYYLIKIRENKNS